MRLLVLHYIRMLLVAALCSPAYLHAEQKSPPSPDVVLEKLDASPHTLVVEREQTSVVDHEIGLSALKKVRGAWRFDDSERVTAQRQSYTWQIVDGFSTAEVMDQLLAYVATLQTATSLFACEGRACGHGSQWANRVFRQRVLYGRADLQRYQVFSIGGEGNEQSTDESRQASLRLVIYSATRSEDRQYLHVELLRLSDAQGQEILSLP